MDANANDCVTIDMIRDAMRTLEQNSPPLKKYCLFGSKAQIRHWKTMYGDSVTYIEVGR